MIELNRSFIIVSSFNRQGPFGERAVGRRPVSSRWAYCVSKPEAILGVGSLAHPDCENLGTHMRGLLCDGRAFAQNRGGHLATTKPDCRT